MINIPQLGFAIIFSLISIQSATRGDMYTSITSLVFFIAASVFFVRDALYEKGAQA